MRAQLQAVADVVTVTDGLAEAPQKRKEVGTVAAAERAGQSEGAAAARSEGRGGQSLRRVLPLVFVDFVQYCKVEEARPTFLDVFGEGDAARCGFGLPQGFITESGSVVSCELRSAMVNGMSSPSAWRRPQRGQCGARKSTFAPRRTLPQGGTAPTMRQFEAFAADDDHQH